MTISVWPLSPISLGMLWASRSTRQSRGNFLRRRLFFLTRRRWHVVARLVIGFGGATAPYRMRMKSMLRLSIPGRWPQLIRCPSAVAPVLPVMRAPRGIVFAPPLAPLVRIERENRKRFLERTAVMGRVRLFEIGDMKPGGQVPCAICSSDSSKPIRTRAARTRRGRAGARSMFRASVTSRGVWPAPLPPKGVGESNRRPRVRASAFNIQRGPRLPRVAGRALAGRMSDLDTDFALAHPPCLRTHATPARCVFVV